MVLTTTTMSIPITPVTIRFPTALKKRLDAAQRRMEEDSGVPHSFNGVVVALLMAAVARSEKVAEASKPVSRT